MGSTILCFDLDYLRLRIIVVGFLSDVIPSYDNFFVYLKIKEEVTVFVIIMSDWAFLIITNTITVEVFMLHIGW